MDLKERIEKLKARYAAISDPQDKSRLGLELADCLIQNNDHQEAIVLLMEILPLCVSQNRQGAVLRRLGEASFRRSDFKTALEYLEQAAQALAGVGDFLEEFRTYRDSAWVYARQGFFDKAEEFSLRAEAALGEAAAGDRLVEIARSELLHLKALLSGNRGEKERALAYYREELEILEKMGDKERMAPIYINMGNIYYTQGRVSDCLDCQLQAKEILENTDNRFTLSVVYNNIAELYWSLGDYAKAQEYYEYNTDLAQLTENTIAEVITQAGLARVYRGQRRYAEAEACYRAAASLALEIASPAKQAVILGELADMMADEKRIEEADRVIKEARKTMLETYGYETPRCAVVEAKILMERGRRSSGRLKHDYLLRAEKILMPLQSPPLRLPSEEVVSQNEYLIEIKYLLALIYHELGREEARDYLRDCQGMIDAFVQDLPTKLRTTYWERPEIVRITTLAKQIMP